MRNLSQLIGEAPRNVKKVVRGVGFCFLGMGLYTLVSCTAMSKMSEGEKGVLGGEALRMISPNDGSKKSEAMDNAADLLGIYGDIKVRKEIAEAGRDQIIINNYPNQNQEQQRENQISKNPSNTSPRVIILRETPSRTKQIYPGNKTPRGLFTYSKWMDFDGNGAMSGKELLGFNPISLSKDASARLAYCTYKNSRSGKTKLNIWNLNTGKLVYRQDFTYKCWSVQMWNLSFITNNNPGTYKAIIITTKNKKSSLDFRVVK